jgi:hypothetical protein
VFCVWFSVQSSPLKVEIDLPLKNYKEDLFSDGKMKAQECPIKNLKFGLKFFVPFLHILIQFVRA